jgi:hypothetical protein
MVVWMKKFFKYLVREEAFQVRNYLLSFLFNWVFVEVFLQNANFFSIVLGGIIFGFCFKNLFREISNFCEREA